MCQIFIPCLAPEGRIVNISSVASSLKPYDKHIQERFRNPNLTLAELEAQEFEQSVSNKTDSASGFSAPGRSYSFSKALINSLTAILARDNPGLTINACCPGWVHTDMGLLVGSKNTKPPKTPEQGAFIPYRLAFEDIGGVTGRYWANGNVRSKERGEVQEW